MRHSYYVITPLTR